MAEPDKSPDNAETAREAPQSVVRDEAGAAAATTASSSKAPPPSRPIGTLSPPRPGRSGSGAPPAPASRPASGPPPAPKSSASALTPPKSSSSVPAAAAATDTTAPVAPKAPAATANDPEASVDPARSEKTEASATGADPSTSATHAIDGNGRKPSAPSQKAQAAVPSTGVEARAVARAKDEASDGRKSERPSAAGSPSVLSMPVEARPLAAYEMLARSARLADLVTVTQQIVSEAARSRVSGWFFSSKVTAAAEEQQLSHEDADTRFGNALDVLSTGGESPAERALACALWAHAVAEAPRGRPEEEDSLAGDILWLATHTSFDATPLLDRALGEDAADLWTAIADRIRRIERGRGGALGRGEAIVGCAALAASSSERAKALCAELATEVKDPVLLRLLATGEQAATEEIRLEGELLPARRGPVVTTLLAFTGILLVLHAVRLVARLALAYRRPAEVSLSESGVRVKTRTEMLGRTLREREHVILRTGLVRVVREVRFPRLAFYAGLLALATGSYVGVRAFTDGVRAASPSLLLVGIAIVALGIALDFVLGTLIPGSRGRCRLAFVPRKGPTLCVGDVDVRRADDAIARSLVRR